MSQHCINVQSPAHGRVLVRVGFDARLNDIFANAEPTRSGYDGFMATGLSVDSIASVVNNEFGVDLPTSVIEGVKKDIEDFQAGATDVGRRIYEYSPTGELVNQVVY